MATAVGEKESIVELEPSINEARAPINSHHVRNISRKTRKCKLRGIGSRSPLIILAWSFFIRSTVKGMDIKDKKSEWEAAGVYFLTISLAAVSLPIICFLAEVVISRYQLVRYSLRAMWLLAIIDCIIVLCIDSLLLPTSTWYNIQVFLVVIPKTLIYGSYLVSIVPFGIDQITEGSNANISALIQWMAWVIYTAIALPGILTHTISQYVSKNEVDLILSILSVLLLSIGLIIDFMLHTKLVKEPVTSNPFTLIYRVLKYAAKNKYPVRRSAFTYCENEQPSRLDNGKSKYGGPFTTEQVEDVKTFWRILLVIIIISMFLLPLSAEMLVSNNHLSLSQHKWIQHVSNILTGHVSIVMFGIPLYELIVYPYMRNRGPTILQSLGIGAIALLLVSVYGLGVETLQYFITSGTRQCVFTQDETCFYINIPFNIILGFTNIVLTKSIIEFICAQAPYNMRGLIMGFYFTVFWIFTIPSPQIYNIWRRKLEALDATRGGIWLHLTMLVIMAGLCALLGCTLRQYKPRERDEVARSQAIVEDMYYKYQEQEANYVPQSA